jgi:glycosyltransferase involved in cell wall biosynthesis
MNGSTFAGGPIVRQRASVLRESMTTRALETVSAHAQAGALSAGRHVLLIHQAFVTPEDGGGTRHYELLTHAAASGHRATVVTADVGYLSRNDRTKHATSHGPSLVVHCVKSLAGKKSDFISQLRNLVGFATVAIPKALSVDDVDLVMGTSPSIFQALSAWFVSAVKRKPYLLEIRDLWPEFIIGMGKLKNPVAIAVARGLERFLYSRADHLLVNSPAYVDYLVSKGVARTRISLIPNGVETELFAPSAQRTAAARAFRDRYGVGDKYVVMYTGAISPANDLGVLLDAADRLRDLPNVHFLIVGDGKSRGELEEEAMRRDLRNVTFTGTQPKASIPDVLAAADLCVAVLQNIPEFRLTYPNKVFDYLASGKPVALAIDGVIRTVVEDAGAGVFVPPGHPAAMASAVRAFAIDPARARSMGERGRTHVARKFDRRAHGAAFGDLLTSVANR